MGQRRLPRRSGHRLREELRRFGDPSIVVWLLALAAAMPVGWATVAVGGGARLEHAALRLAAVAAAASVLVALAFSLDPYESPGTWIAAGDELAIIGVAIGVLVKGPAHLRLACVIGLGLMALAIGLIHGPVFLHPIVLAALPSTVTRALTLVGLAAGIDAAAIGCVAYLHSGPSLPRVGDRSDLQNW